MKTKKSEIFSSILLLLPACLLVYQVFIKDITKDNPEQTISNNESVETVNSSNYSLQQNQDTNTNTKNNTVNTNANTEQDIINTQSNTENEDSNTQENTNNLTLDSSNVVQSTLKSISIDSYASNLSTSNYIVKQGDTVSNILRNFQDTCNYKTALTHLKLFNPNIDLNEIEINSTLNIPTTALEEGRLYKVVSGDTWYKLAKSNYPEYNTDDIIDFLIVINDLPNADLPLGENVFLPNLGQSISLCKTNLSAFFFV